MEEEKPTDWRQIHKDRLWGPNRRSAEIKYASQLYVKEIGFVEKPIAIAINGPGEVVPKRRYLSMGRAIHMGIVRIRQANDILRKELGLEPVGQPAMFRALFMDLLEERAALRAAMGLPEEHIDPTPWMNPDQLLWADDQTMRKVTERFDAGEYERALASTQRGKDNVAKREHLKRQRKVLVDSYSGEPLPLPPRDAL